MSIKNILVHVDGTERSARTVETACTVAKGFGARLTGFFVMPDVTVAAAVTDGAMANSQLIVDMQDAAEKRADDAEAIFREETGRQAIDGDWFRADAPMSGARSAAAATAFYSDLVIAGQYGESSGSPTDPGLAEDLVIDSGRPLLLVPESAGADEGKRILIGWKESREAAKAVHDALPFLSKADSVAIAMVTEQGDAPEDDISGTRIAKLLADHGVNAEIQTVAAKTDESTSEALFNHARTWDADMLVAGAYSHSRLREGIFGGVSKSIFSSAPLPVLLSN